MIGRFEFPVEIVRTDRKRSVSIQLEGTGIKVRVPKGLSDNRIHDLIVKRSPWIRKKLKEAELFQPAKSKEYVSGETFPYLGKNYRLKIVSGETPSLKLKGGYLEATVPDCGLEREQEIRSHLLEWYQQHALKRLEEKTRRYAKIIGVNPQSVTIKNYKSRWGSCSVKGDVSYNWRIILAPHRIVDYVVVHELCHLLEHNHSSRYWKHVERHVPDYKERREWLRTAGAGSLVL